MLVYSATWCRDCREAKRFLEKHQIAYTEIDIETSPGAAEEVIRNVANGPSLNSYSTANGYSLTVRATASFTRKWPSFRGPNLLSGNRGDVAIRRPRVVQDAACVLLILRTHL